MKWSLRRRVDATTMDEIDAKIDEHQHHAEELIAELTVTVEETGQLWRQLKEAKGDGDPGTVTA